MKRFFVDKSSFKGDKIVIEGIEHNHIKNVMRLNVGDSIVVVCGDEYDYYATITDMKKGETVVTITDKKENPYNPNFMWVLYTITGKLGSEDNGMTLMRNQEGKCEPRVLHSTKLSFK